MNLLLIKPEQLLNNNEIQLDQRQLYHLNRIIKPENGDYLNIGELNGRVGRARVVKQSSDNIVLDHIELLNDAPPPIPLTIILAIPRPQQLKRIMQTVATMGVQKICLIQTQRAEKSFWQSPSAKDEAIHEQLILGLEQGRVTYLPIIEKYTHFRSFVENTLPHLSKNHHCWVAHLGDYKMAEHLGEEQSATLAIGPEGGFIDQEINTFCQHGFEPRQLGPRILKVETAVTALIAKMY